MIELGAYWVRSMLRAMDTWYASMRSFGIAGKRLPEPPSAYVRRNVRFSVFPWEDLASYIQGEGLADVICFASDYPHLEGGRDMINTMYHKIAPLGSEAVEKFFVTNGQWLLPD